MGRQNTMIKLIPYLISERNPLFNYKNCTFCCEKEKENTARLVMFKELNITNSYTIECSFYGSKALAEKRKKENNYEKVKVAKRE